MVDQIISRVISRGLFQHTAFFAAAFCTRPDYSPPTLFLVGFGMGDDDVFDSTVILYLVMYSASRWMPWGPARFGGVKVGGYRHLCLG